MQTFGLLDEETEEALTIRESERKKAQRSLQSAEKVQKSSKPHYVIISVNF